MGVECGRRDREAHGARARVQYAVRAVHEVIEARAQRFECHDGLGVVEIKRVNDNSGGKRRGRDRGRGRGGNCVCGVEMSLFDDRDGE